MSSRRLTKYLEDNEPSTTKEQVTTFKGYIITKVDSAKHNYKAIEVTNIQTHEVTKYSSVRSATDSLGIPSASISTYLNRKRTTPYKGKYLFKFI